MADLPNARTFSFGRVLDGGCSANSCSVARESLHACRWVSASRSSRHVVGLYRTGTGLGAIRGGDQVTLRLPSLLAVLGELGWNVPRHGLPVSTGPQVQLLARSWARIASACWLMSGGAGPPRRACCVPCLRLQDAGVQGNNTIFVSSKFYPRHL